MKPKRKPVKKDLRTETDLQREAGATRGMKVRDPLPAPGKKPGMAPQLQKSEPKKKKNRPRNKGRQ